MTRRCFISIDIESSDKKGKLTELRDIIAKRGDVRPVPEANFHITMNFLGDVKENEIDDITREIRDSLERCSCEKKSITIGGLGTFPNKSYITVVWAGIIEGNSYLRSLHDTVTEPLPQRYIDEHTFTPHITLCRVSNLTREQKNDIHQVLDQYEQTELFRKQVRSIKLKESVLSGDIPTYRTLEEYEV